MKNKIKKSFEQLNIRIITNCYWLCPNMVMNDFKLFLKIHSCLEHWIGYEQLKIVFIDFT